MKDSLSRDINYLRVSITDNCNLRCIYCMPEEGAICHKEEDMISMEEAFKLVEIFSSLGIEKVRITGGEPLLRKGVCDLIKNINSLQTIKEIGITTNGVLLYEYLDELVESGLTTLNISLDTINEEKFKKMTRYGKMYKVINAIKKARNYNLKVKLNSLIIQGFNDDEVLSLVNFAIENDVILRFIELMPIGHGKNLKGFKNEDIRKIIEKKYELAPYKSDKLDLTKGPAVYYKISSNNKLIGFISPISKCFCESCNRVRITSDGKLKECLYYEGSLNLKEELRKGTSNGEIKDKIIKALTLKKEHHKFFENDETYDDEKKDMSMIGG